MLRDLPLLLTHDLDHRTSAEDTVMLLEHAHELHPVPGQPRIDLTSRCGRPWAQRSAAQRNSCGGIQQVTAIAGLHVAVIVPPRGAGISGDKALGDGR